MKMRAAMLLCCMLVCTALSAGAVRDESGFAHRLTDEAQVAITGYAGCDVNPVIPSAIGGHPVTGIDDWALSYNSSINGITVRASIVAIGDFAFAGCRALAAIGVQEGNPAYSSVGGAHPVPGTVRRGGNLRFPKFDWISEMIAVKQGASTLIAMFGAMALVALPTILYATALSGLIKPENYIALVTLLIFALAAEMYVFLQTKGEKMFAALNA